MDTETSKESVGDTTRIIKRAQRAAMLLLIGCFFLAGCGSDKNVVCTGDTDCAGGVCVDGRCAECQVDADCSSGAACVEGWCVESCGAGSCSGHGLCDDSTGSIVCDCDAGYAGDDCSSCDIGYGDYGDGECRPIDPCQNNTDCALLNRECVNDQGTARCGRCLDGYTEVEGQCEEDTICRPDSCSGHGSCDDSGGSVVCTCDAGYTGDLCEACAAGYHEEDGSCAEDVACGQDSCSGHGDCDDSSGLPVCTCDAGYGGVNCDACANGYVPWPEGSDTCVDDPCEPDPCNTANAVPGSCVQTEEDRVQCACDAGYVWSGAACVPQASCTDDDLDGCGIGDACVCSDCNDTDPEVYQGAPERCDGKDNDCDGAIDEDFTDKGQACDGADADLCAYGIYTCTADGLDTECADEAITDIQETCDGEDNDCDGDTDEDLGQVACGTGLCTHSEPACVDGSPAVCDPFAGAQPEACDTLDNDCDGLTDEDFAVLGLECDGDDADACRNGTWTCTADGLGVECANEVSTDIPEICDGADNDCDGLTDEDFAVLGLDCDGGDADACENGSWTCTADGLGVECINEAATDIPETCDGDDNDCDGLIDEGLGQTTCGQGVCLHTVDNCQSGQPQTCDPFEGSAPEVCDGLDNDCNGTPDDNAGCGSTTVGQGDFPLDTYGVVTENVALDVGGDIILKRELSDYRYMWIPLQFDVVDGVRRGTISKIDTTTMMEVARYLTVSCSNSGYSYDNCLDTMGNLVTTSYARPGGVAFAPNGDVWLSNEAWNTGPDFDGQPSVTRIALNTGNCVEKNGQPGIQTSYDADGDGSIDTSDPDEFPGLDDECVLYTVNVGIPSYRNLGIAVDWSGNVWSASNSPSLPNSVYRVAPDGSSVTTVRDNLGMWIYGLLVNPYGILWAYGVNASGVGSVFAINTNNLGDQSAVLVNPFGQPFNGGCNDFNQHLWLTGGTDRLYRAVPQTPGQGNTNVIWSRARYVDAAGTPRGIAADGRGYIWTAHTNGYVSRSSSFVFPDPGTSYDIDFPPGVFVSLANGETDTEGVGVDLFGKVWAINTVSESLSSFGVSDDGDFSGVVFSRGLGGHPWSISNFTGYGLFNFVVTYDPNGTYKYLLEPCLPPSRTLWKTVTWSSTEPAGTGLALTVRLGDDEDTIGSEAPYGPWTASPVNLEALITDNTSGLLEAAFELTTSDTSETPTLHEFTVTWECVP